MTISRTTRRSFPFFKREVRVVLENLSSDKTLREIANQSPLVFQPEISDILDIDPLQTLENLRGRPEAQDGAEVGREILLRIQGQAPSGHLGEKTIFEATIESKFKEFKQGKIIYRPNINVPESFEFSDLKGLLAAPDVEFTKIEFGLDYFGNREFPFLGIKLQGLKERLHITCVSQTSGSGSLINGVIENNNAQIPEGFSRKIQSKLEIFARITGIADISKEISR